MVKVRNNLVFVGKCLVKPYGAFVLDGASTQTSEYESARKQVLADIHTARGEAFQARTGSPRKSRVAVAPGSGHSRQMAQVNTTPSSNPTSRGLAHHRGSTVTSALPDLSGRYINVTIAPRFPARRKSSMVGSLLGMVTRSYRDTTEVSSECTHNLPSFISTYRP